MSFEGLTKLMRLARIDLGIEFELDIAPFTKDDNGLSSSHWVLGHIRYADNETAEILYLKLSLTGDEPMYLNSYRNEHTEYPHQSTAHQFFQEEQFEAYRALGEHIAETAFSKCDKVKGLVDRIKSAAMGENR